MPSFKTPFLVTIASLVLVNLVLSQDIAISERNLVLENPALNNNIFRRCVTGCSTETPACPTCPAGTLCTLTPPSCDACQSTVCAPSPSSSILPTASAPANPTFSGAGTSAFSMQLTGFPVIVVAGGIAACLL